MPVNPAPFELVFSADLLRFFYKQYSAHGQEGRDFQYDDPEKSRYPWRRTDDPQTGQMEQKKLLQVYQISWGFFAVFAVNLSFWESGERLLYAEIVNAPFYPEPFSAFFQSLLREKIADRMCQSLLVFPGETHQCRYPLPLVRRSYYEQEQILFSEGCDGQAWIVPEQADAVWQ